MGFATAGISWLRDDADGVLPIARDADTPHVLAPLLTSTFRVLADQLRVAAALARASGASLSVVDPVPVAGSIPTEYRSDVGDTDDRDLICWALGRAGDRSTVAGRPVSVVLRAADAHGVDTLVLPGSSAGGLLRRPATERIAVQASADVVVVNGRAGYDGPASILLPVAGGPHSGVATDVASRVAADCDAWVDVLHVVEEDAPERRRRAAQAYVDAAARRIGCPETTSTWVLEAPAPAAAIARQSRYYGLTVVGAPTSGRLRRFVHGSTNRSVRASANSVVLSARVGGDATGLLGRGSDGSTTITPSAAREGVHVRPDHYPHQNTSD